MKRWKLKHKWGLEFEFIPKFDSIYASLDFNGVTAWTEFSCEGDYKSAAKWLRKVADKIEAIETTTGETK